MNAYTYNCSLSNINQPISIRNFLLYTLPRSHFSHTHRLHSAPGVMV